MTSAYIHIPFCEHICYYCDFNKVFLKGQPVDEYIEALIKEIKLTQLKHPTKRAETIYIGGGTPTTLTAKQLDRLLAGVREELPFVAGDEFTVEANPGDLTAEKLAVMKNYDVNRLSMGVQSFDDRLLKKIGRKHSVQDVYDTMKVLEKADMTNVSIDLIYALPGQSFENFEDTLDKAIALDLPHYSMYSLILENKTMFNNWARQGRLNLPTEDEEGDMFELATRKMAAAGRPKYEVSNFALPGHESQHNLVYWNNDHYYGIGAGASGYIGDERYRNHGPIQHYLEPLRNDQLPIIETEQLSQKQKMEEEMFLGLRKIKGISRDHFADRYEQTLDSVYETEITGLIEEGLLQENKGFISLTDKGMILGNTVFERFIK